MPINNVFADPLVRRALGSLLCAGLATPFAQAQDITSETTVPVSTDTVAGGTPGDVVVTETGSIVLSGTEGVAAITLNSHNSIRHDGLISITNTDSVTGIQVQSGWSGDVTIGGAIALLEDYERLDTDDDGDADGPLALGTDRHGIRLETGGWHEGNIVLDAGATISVEGNTSTGVSLLSTLDGDVLLKGGISVVGDQAIGVDLRELIDGNVLLRGAISARGTDAQAVSVSGGVSGALTIETALTSTGFTSTEASNYIAPLNVDEDTPDIQDRIDAEDLKANGPTLSIARSIANGLLVNGSMLDLDPKDPDLPKTDPEDYNANRATGSITSIGSAPAVLIAPDATGLATSDIFLGQVSETVRDTLDNDGDGDTEEMIASFRYAHGLINRGSILADGLNIGYQATGLQVRGSLDSQFSTEILGGIQNTRIIEAKAYEADATAIDFGRGGLIGSLRNSGRISSQVNTINGDEAIAVKIDAGAWLETIENAGTVFSETIGDSGSAFAIIDHSGSLTEISNTGTISATLSGNGLSATGLGRAVAVDVSRSLADVSLTQSRATEPVGNTNGDDAIDARDIANPVLNGDIIFGAGNDQFNVLAGSVTGDTTFGLGDAQMTLDNARYLGNVTFSDGVNVLNLSNQASFNGTLRFDNGLADVALMNSSFSGRLISSGRLSSFSAIDSDIMFSSDTAASLGQFSIQGDSLLQVAIDPQRAGGTPHLTVEQIAEIGPGVTIQPSLQAILPADFSYTLIEAGDLIYQGALDNSLIVNAPFLYSVSLAREDADRDALRMTFDLKTSEELGFDLNQAAAYSAVLEVFSADPELGAALAAIDEEKAFFEVYNLLLPQRTDAATRYLSSQSTAAFGALANRLDTIAVDAESRTGVWAQEYYTYLDLENETATPGYNGTGLGLATGIDRPLGPIDVAGLFITYSSGDFEEKTGSANPVTTSSFGVGLYARESLGIVDLSLAGQVSGVEFHSRRVVDLADRDYEQKAAWEGSSIALSAGLSSMFEQGRLFARPKLSVDYFWLDQDAYSETGNANLPAPTDAQSPNLNDRLALAVDAAQTDRLSTSAVLEVGARFRTGRYGANQIIPHLSLGYRSERSSTPYSTQARFLSSETQFDIRAQDRFSDALLAGLGLSTESPLGSARFGFDAEVSENGITHFGGATLKLKF